MKAEWIIFGAIGGFLGGAALLYWFTSYEHAGSVALAVAATAALFIATYLLTRRTGSRPEDRTDAVPRDAPGVVGDFAASSIWPFVLGLGAVIVAYGFAFTAWLALPGVGLLLLGVAGYAREAHAAGS